MTEAVLKEFAKAVADATLAHGKPTIPLEWITQAREALVKVAFNQDLCDEVSDAICTAIDPDYTHGGQNYRTFVEGKVFSVFPATRFLAQGVEVLSVDEVAVILICPRWSRQATELITDAVRNDELSPVWEQVRASLSEDEIQLVPDDDYQVLGKFPTTHEVQT
jgi:hypothetical protein